MHTRHVIRADDTVEVTIQVRRIKEDGMARTQSVAVPERTSLLDDAHTADSTAYAFKRAVMVMLIDLGMKFEDVFPPKLEAIDQP